MRNIWSPVIVVIVFLSALAVFSLSVFATTDTIGGTTSGTTPFNVVITGGPVTASASGTLQSLGLNLDVGGHIRIAIYSNSSASSKPDILLAQSSDTVAVSGWNDISITNVTIVQGTKYWIAVQAQDGTPTIYWIVDSRCYAGQAYGTFPNPFTGSEPSVTCDSNQQHNLRMIYAPYTPTSIQLWLNNTNGNITGAYPITLNATAKINVTNLPVELYKDGVLIANATTTVFNSTIWEAGHHTIRAYYPGNATYSSAETIYYANITAISVALSLSSSNGWNYQQGASTTLSCSASPSRTLAMTSNGASISNPYTAIFPYGVHSIGCSLLSADVNYTATPISQALNAYTNATGCTNANSYVYSATVASSGNITLNFTNLVAQGIVKSDLSDVYVETSANTWVFLNSTHKLLRINGTSSVYSIKFGNSFTSNSYSNTSAGMNQTLTPFTYSQSTSYYYILNILDEMNGSILYPIPSANTTITLNCPNGADTYNTTSGIMIFPTTQQLTSARVTATYSPTSIYYRDLTVTSPIQPLNFYMLDAMNFQVIQLLLSLQDNSGGQFPSPSIVIDKTLGGQNIVITQLPFDAESKAIVYLQNGGTYQIYITSGSNTRGIGNLFVDNVNLQKTLLLGPNPITVSNANNVSYSMTMDNTTGMVTFNWFDPFNNTLNITMNVYNASTNALLSSFSSTNSTNVVFNYLGDPTGIYRIDAIIEHKMLGDAPWHLPFIIGGIIANVLVPTITIPTAFLMWTGFILISSVAMVFDQANASLGGIITALLGLGIFILMQKLTGNWLFGGFALGMAAVIFAILNHFGSRRREEVQ